MKKTRITIDNTPPKVQMTSMIDVVFLLLSFFILTFKVVEQEGELRIKMPLTGAQNTVAQRINNEPIEPLRVYLHANEDGSLRDIQVGNEHFGPNADMLQQHVKNIVGTPVGNEADKWEAELDCDPNLEYQHTVTAMSKIRGYLHNNQVMPLIENIKFAPRK